MYLVNELFKVTKTQYNKNNLVIKRTLSEHDYKLLKLEFIQANNS